MLEVGLLLLADLFKSLLELALLLGVEGLGFQLAPAMAKSTVESHVRVTMTPLESVPPALMILSPELPA